MGSKVKLCSRETQGCCRRWTMSALGASVSVEFPKPSITSVCKGSDWKLSAENHRGKLMHSKSFTSKGKEKSSEHEPPLSHGRGRCPSPPYLAGNKPGPGGAKKHKSHKEVGWEPVYYSSRLLLTLDFCSKPRLIRPHMVILFFPFI